MKKRSLLKGLMASAVAACVIYPAVGEAMPLAPHAGIVAPLVGSSAPTDVAPGAPRVEQARYYYRRYYRPRYRYYRPYYRGYYRPYYRPLLFPFF